MLKAVQKLKHILLVDDDPISIFLTSSYLRDLRIGERIEVASNGLEALQFLQSNCLNQGSPGDNCPDLVLLDLNMPLMNGFEFLEQCRKLGYFDRWKTKIIILTSSKASRDLDKVRQYPVHGYLLKPITENELMEVLDGEFAE